MPNLVELVNKKYMNPNVGTFPDFRTGDTLKVFVKITEGEKSRIQLYEGVCIDICDKNSINGHFCIRKVTDGTGVERVFPYHSPNVTKLEIVARGKSRRAKHYYLRERSGKDARIAIDYDR